MRSVKFKNLTWIDFDNPNAENIDYLRENFNIHPIPIEEFITPTIRPKATQYDNCLFLTVHIPLFLMSQIEQLTQGNWILLSQRII